MVTYIVFTTLNNFTQENSKFALSPTKIDYEASAFLDYGEIAYAYALAPKLNALAPHLILALFKLRFKYLLLFF